EQYVARAIAQLLHDALVELLDRGELGLRHVGDLLDGREALLREDRGDVLVDVELLHEVLHEFLRLGLALGLGVGFGHDVEIPAAELAREADDLAAAPDRLRQLVLRHRDVHAVRVLVHDDRHDLRRRHGVDHELGRIIDVGNDVDALAGDLVGHRLHARAAHADAGPHRIDARVVAAHRDLGAHSGVARRAEDLDEALPDLGDFELEELDQKLGRRARQEQLRTARLRAHLLQVRLDAILGLCLLARDHDRIKAYLKEVRFDAILGLRLLARDHVDARHEAFRVAAEVNVDAVAVDALDHPAHQRADAVAVGVDDLGALRLAHFLNDHLLGLLGGDPPEGHRLHRLLDVAARFSLGIELERVLEPQLVLGLLELLGVVGEHLPAPEGLVVAALAVDGDAHVPLLAVFLAGRGRERGFERLEDHFLVDALLVGDGVHHHQDFLVHCAAYLSNTRAPVRTQASPRQSLQTS